MTSEMIDFGKIIKYVTLFPVENGHGSDGTSFAAIDDNDYPAGL